jgi:POLQ-like helicase
MRKTWPIPLYSAYQKEMRRCAADYFAARGLATYEKYPFILRSRDDWRANIIVAQVAEYIAEARRRSEAARDAFPLHRYIHHGLSSQAMLFNLLGPLVVAGDLAAIREAFTAAGAPWPKGKISGAFEYDDREVFAEHQPQPTSLDFAIFDESGEPAILVESKLVEQEFGGCSVFGRGDCDGRNPADDFDGCYLHAAGRLYWEALARHGFLQGDLAGSPICVLASYYQYFREVTFALEKKSALVFLVDERNPVFHVQAGEGARGLIPFLERFLPAGAAGSVRMVTVQSVLASIEATGRHDSWTGEFRQKYGM